MPRLVNALVLVLMGTVAAPLAGQESELRRPESWRLRADRPDADTTGLYFVAMPPGWHITTGPSVILWDPDATASGTYTLETEIFFFRNNSRDSEGYGIILGGRNLDGPGQDYAYLLLRNDGRFTVKHRYGAEVHTIQDWTPHEAIVRHTEGTSGATVRNTIRVEAGDDSVSFFINDRAVASYPRSHLKADGMVGLRVSHGLNLHVTRLTVTR